MASTEQRYWCHQCSRIVETRLNTDGSEELECLLCDSPFVEGIEENEVGNTKNLDDDGIQLMIVFFFIQNDQNEDHPEHFSIPQTGNDDQPAAASSIRNNTTNARNVPQALGSIVAQVCDLNLSTAWFR